MLRWAAVLLVSILPVPAPAQTETGSAFTPAPAIDPSTLSDQDLLTLLREIESRRNAPKRAFILGVPLAFGSARGQAFLAAAATNRRDRRRVGDWDASLVMGFGLGDARRGIGVTPVVEITSVSPFHFGSSGRVGLSFSRRFAPVGKWQSAASLGLQNLVTWGDSNILDPEWNVTFSSIRLADSSLRFPVLVSAGYGSAVRNFGSDPGFYGGVGIGLHKSFGVSLGWYGDEAIAGASLWVGRRKNLLINAGIGDILNNVTGRRLLLTAALGMRPGKSR